MKNTVVIDEIHITLVVPTGLGTAETQRILQAVMDASFMVDIRRAIRRVVRRRPALQKVRVRISR